MKASAHRRQAGGFTLIEVVVALSLLAFGLALTFGTLRGASRATERADATAARSERLRAVQGFVRTQAGGALPIAYEIDPATGEGRYVRGDAQRLEFVAAMPGYLSRGGPYLQTLELRPGREGKQLVFSFRLLTPDGPLDAEREPKVLLDGIADGGFEFRTINDQGSAGDWRSDWQARGQMPPLMRLKLRFNDSREHWPDLVVALRLGAAFTGTGVVVGGEGQPVPSSLGGKE